MERPIFRDPNSLRIIEWKEEIQVRESRIKIVD